MSSNHDATRISGFLAGVGTETRQHFMKLIREQSGVLAEKIETASPVRKSGYSHKMVRGKGRTRLPRGTYQRGWTFRAIMSGDDAVAYRICNKSDQKHLVHLLEFGHEMVTHSGETIGTVAGIPHVINNRNATEEELTKSLEGMVNDAADTAYNKS